MLVGCVHVHVQQCPPEAREFTRINDAGGERCWMIVCHVQHAHSALTSFGVYIDIHTLYYSVGNCFFCISLNGMWGNGGCNRFWTICTRSNKFAHYVTVNGLKECISPRKDIEIDIYHRRTCFCNGEVHM